MNVVQLFIGICACIIVLVALDYAYKEGVAHGLKLGVADVCGPCNQTAECGPYVCTAGETGWHHKNDSEANNVPRLQ